jgi:hypothetical protein
MKRSPRADGGDSQSDALLGVEQWAEIRRMKHVERLSQREIHRRTGVHRDTIRKAVSASAVASSPFGHRCEATDMRRSSRREGGWDGAGERW